MTVVGHLIKSLRTGGAEVLLREHLEAGSNEDFSYSVAYCKPAYDDLVPELVDTGTQVHLVARNEAALATSREFWHWISGLDVLHVHSPLAASAVRFLSATTRRIPPIVYTEHGMWDQYHPTTRRVNAATFSLNSRAVAVSARVASSMSRAARQETEVLHHGIEPVVKPTHSAREALRSSLGLSSSEFAFVTVANFRPEKNLELLVRCAAALNCDSEIRFFHIGHGSLAPDIHRLNDSLGSPVTFLGKREDVRQLLGAFDSFLLSSDHEGLPVALMEALSAGLPVVATRSGGVGELVVDGDHGHLTDPGDLEALVAACQRIIEGTGDGTFDDGLARIRGQLDRTRFVRRFETIYRDLTEAGSPG